MVSPKPVTFLWVALLAAASSPGLAAEPERAAIQERKYQLFHELRLSAGAMPLNPYQKGWTLSLGYAAHLSELVSVEVQLTGAALTSTNLRDDLIDQFAVPPEDFTAPRLMATAGVEIAPLYGKQAFMNDEIVHHALLAGFYAGAMFGDRESIGDTFSDVRPTVGIGLGYRVFANEALSVRFDVRDFFAFKRPIRDDESFEVENVLFLTISIGYSFWRDA